MGTLPSARRPGWSRLCGTSPLAGLRASSAAFGEDGRCADLDSFLLLIREALSLLTKWGILRWLPAATQRDSFSKLLIIPQDTC